MSLPWSSGIGTESTEFFTDTLGLTQDDLQHGAVDRVVLAVEHGGAHFARFLAEAVDTAFTLLVTGGIPRQVVVHHAVKRFCRLIPSDRQSVATRMRRSASPMASTAASRSARRELARYRRYLMVAEDRAQIVRPIVRSGDVAAEHYRLETGP